MPRSTVVRQSTLLRQLGTDQFRLWSFVDQHYDKAPHAGLMGRSPETVFAERKREDVRVTEAKIRDAMTIRGPRRVFRDSTLSVDGVVFETHAIFLAGRTVTVARWQELRAAGRAQASRSQCLSADLLSQCHPWQA